MEGQDDWWLIVMVQTIGDRSSTVKLIDHEVNQCLLSIIADDH